MRIVTITGIAAAALAVLALVEVSRQVPPASQDLTRIEGIAGQVSFYPPARRTREHAVVQILITPTEHRLVRTYDVALARNVASGKRIAAGIHQERSLISPSVLELWTLEQAGTVSRTYAETLAVRGPEIADAARRVKLFLSYCVVYAVGALFIRARQRKR